MQVLSIGEVLWDVFPDREFLGGAPLNVCANLRRAGDEAALLSAVGDDPRGESALAAMKVLGLTTDFMQVSAHLSTGTAIVDIDARGEPVFTILRPTAFDAIELPAPILTRIAALAPQWLYMGTLAQTVPAMELLIAQLRAHLPCTRCFYDMNLRPGHWNLALVERLCHAASVLKLNDVEARILSSFLGEPVPQFSLEDFCSVWAKRFAIDVICVTLGPAGCLIHRNGRSERFAGFAIQVSDTIGAGDAFAAAFLHGYQAGWPMANCARFANALGALVASRPGATPQWRMEECYALANFNPETPS